MKKFFFSLIMLALACPVMLHADETQDLYDRARSLYADGDIAGALQLYEQSAMQGGLDAQKFLAEYYIGKDDYANAFRWFKVLETRLDDTTVKFILATMYMLGMGTTADVPIGLRMMKEAALAGEHRAQSVLGKIYDSGEIVEKDYCEALKWFRMAADNNDSEAQMMVGAYYHLGQCVDKDLFAADEWYVKAAANGNQDAAKYHEQIVQLMQKFAEIHTQLSKKKVEGKHFVVEYDSEVWNMENLDMHTSIIPDAYFFSAKNIEDHVCVLFYESPFNAETFIKEQIVGKANVFFADATVTSECKETSLLDMPAYITFYKKTLNGVQFEGPALALDANGGMLFIYGLSTDFQNSKFYDLLDGMSLIEAESQQLGFEEYVMSSARMINENQPQLADGLVMTAMTPDLKNKLISYTCMFTKLTKDQLNISAVKKSDLLAPLESEYKGNTITQTMLREGYTIRYIYMDMNRNQIGSIDLTPEDYQYILTQ